MTTLLDRTQLETIKCHDWLHKQCPRNSIRQFHIAPNRWRGRCTDAVLWTAEDVRCDGSVSYEEVEKAEKSLPGGTPFALVVIATKVTSDATSRDLPPNSYLVIDQALEKFYSVFSARANLLSNESRYRINVNTASRSDLMTISKIGKIAATTIVIIREKNGPYLNWKDLKTRVIRTAKMKEQWFSY